MAGKVSLFSVISPAFFFGSFKFKQRNQLSFNHSNRAIVWKKFNYRSKEIGR